KPDLVLVTGDLADFGNHIELSVEARRLLERIEAPVLITIGNHDHGFGTRPMFSSRYGAGWRNFARVFHPLLETEQVYGGWSFVGFDSGPSEFSPAILTRGLAPETLADLSSALDRARTEARRGVVFYSHAPTRAVVSSTGSIKKQGVFGRMRRGA